jgi:hypothetical protein
MRKHAFHLVDLMPAGAAGAATRWNTQPIQATG